MNDREEKFTRLTLDQKDLHIVWEVPYDDVSGDDMLNAIRTIMIGMTFSDLGIEKTMADYLRDHYSNYDVVENNDGYM
jgi:hypothetical protein